MTVPHHPIIDSRNTSVVWLDLDDTIIDFQANSLKALEQVYQQLGLNRFFATAEEWINRYHHYNNKLWQDYAPGKITRDYLKMERFRMPLVEAGASIDVATALSETLDPVYLSLLGREKQLVPGAMDLIRRIKNTGLPIGILSNGFKEVQYKKIESAGLKNLIDIIVLSDDIGVNKPDVRLFEHAMKVSKEMQPNRHIMIGDNPDTDIAGALAAGWNAIHYLPNTSVKPANGCPVIENLDMILVK